MNKTRMLIIIVVVILAIGATIMAWSEKSEAPVVSNGSEQSSGENNVPLRNDSVNSGEVKEFNVSGGNFKFSVNEIRVKKGDVVRINFTNDEGVHDIKFDDFNAATKVLKAGEKETIEFVADKAGSFEYYCSVGNHRAMGMKGTIVVE